MTSVEYEEPELPEGQVPWEDLEDTVAMEVFSCARCGRHHVGLEFRRLRRPIRWPAGAEEPAEIVTHWAACPETGEPVLGHWEFVEE